MILRQSERFIAFRYSILRQSQRFIAFQYKLVWQMRGETLIGLLRLFWVWHCFIIAVMFDVWNSNDGCFINFTNGCLPFIYFFFMQSLLWADNFCGEMHWRLSTFGESLSVLGILWMWRSRVVSSACRSAVNLWVSEWVSEPRSGRSTH